jgi:cell division ATPase FtsA
LKSVSQNIKNAIQKAEIDAKIKVNEFVINAISSDLFFEATRINFIRDNIKEIDSNELYKIFKDIETQAFRNNYRRIKNLTGYSKADLKLIINNVLNIQIDNEFYTKDLI